ncbi:MAG: DUF4296 domain-containing protein [Bacteroidota bacterium]
MHFRFRGIFLIIFAALLIGCEKKEQIKGKEFIKREVFVDILVDIHLVDGVTNDRKFHRVYEADEVDLLTSILEKYQVPQSMFDTTLAEYSRYPELFDQVYNDVLIKLNVMLDENDKEETNMPGE